MLLGARKREARANLDEVVELDRSGPGELDERLAGVRRTVVDLGARELDSDRRAADDDRLVERRRRRVDANGNADVRAEAGAARGDLPGEVPCDAAGSEDERTLSLLDADGRRGAARRSEGDLHVRGGNPRHLDLVDRVERNGCAVDRRQEIGVVIGVDVSERERGRRGGVAEPDGSLHAEPRPVGRCATVHEQLVRRAVVADDHVEQSVTADVGERHRCRRRRAGVEDGCGSELAPDRSGDALVQVVGAVRTVDADDEVGKVVSVEVAERE